MVMDFSGARTYILSELQNNLPTDLYYHSVGHTLDVFEATCHLIQLEQPSDIDHELLKTAALWHDAGMLITYRNHEEASVELATRLLPGFGYSNKEIDSISSLIMVTKLPQRALSLSEQILCDADLDYLGRDDFYIHSFQLQMEWKCHHILTTTLPEWLQIQINFLSEHKYFTKSARSLRGETKNRHLHEIKHLLHPQHKSPIPNS